MDTHLKVAIVGAGFAGIGMGVELLRRGITDFALFDKAAEVGGVWRDNTYPGCNCDVPAHLYSFSFAPYRDTRVRYPDQPEVLAYLRTVIENHRLSPYLRLNTNIVAARYDERTATWELTSASGVRVTAEQVVFALGMLHRPRIPFIAGVGEYGGPIFHTAGWDHTVDLAGARVAVIGTGASAVQVIPQLAKTAGHVSVYQRTPTWVLPKPAHDFGRLTRWWLETVPAGHRIHRWVIATAAETVLWPAMVRGWSRLPIELLARAHLRRQIDDPALRRALRPPHRLGEKRILLSNDYFPALTRENVELVTDPIDALTETGIRTEDGAVRAADAIVCATGFRATEFLASVEIRGRGGRLLHQQWAQGARAYLGTAVPGFPNLYMIAGPDTFNTAGSNIAIKESQIRLIGAAMAWRELCGLPAIEPSRAAMTDYQHWRRRALDRTVWPDGGPSWYRTDHGEVLAPWPGTASGYDRLARRHPSTAFTAVPTSEEPASSRSSRDRRAPTS